MLPFAVIEPADRDRYATWRREIRDQLHIEERVAMVRPVESQLEPTVLLAALRHDRLCRARTTSSVS